MSRVDQIKAMESRGEEVIAKLSNYDHAPLKKMEEAIDAIGDLALSIKRLVSIHDDKIFSRPNRTSSSSKSKSRGGKTKRRRRR